MLDPEHPENVAELRVRVRRSGKFPLLVDDAIAVFPS